MLTRYQLLTLISNKLIIAGFTASPSMRHLLAVLSILVCALRDQMSVEEASAMVVVFGGGQ